MYRTVFVASLVSLVTALLVSVLFFSILGKPDIGTVDVAKITTLFIRQEATKNHTHAEKEQAIREFSASLEHSLAMLSKKHSLILMPKEAVIKGGRDYTEHLIAMIAMEQTP